ncbi:helix-turn-helix transcriptional regulator [Amycolatopsis keratiniphila]|uniref:HTH cro/C1-type domain-containing protein n=1 Tax=Amycolatopsis keratiniphila subsp. keratiniphila TaxID=227715 RepID=A0A1W2LHD1_9PSEU|nr:helix-turn-helix transcriptional regulator [Amycolatopsis keratiniphila]ONF62265.1 hypothetical protein AVR91_0238540 [Amycolatopsis keratiniphila subsp. keratiniphila]
MPRKPSILPFDREKSRELREKSGLYLQQFATKIEEVTGHTVSRHTLGRIERGDFRPNAPLLKAMADTFNALAGDGDRVTVDDLLLKVAA